MQPAACILGLPFGIRAGEALPAPRSRSETSPEASAGAQRDRNFLEAEPTFFQDGVRRRCCAPRRTDLWGQSQIDRFRPTRNRSRPRRLIASARGGDASSVAEARTRCVLRALSQRLNMSAPLEDARMVQDSLSLCLQGSRIGEKTFTRHDPRTLRLCPSCMGTRSTTHSNGATDADGR